MVPAGRHDLQSGFRNLVVDVFQIIDGLVLRVGAFDVPDELLGVGVVAESDERAGVVSGHDHVIAFVLTSQLVVIFLVVTGSRMYLDRHVAVAVVGVVVVEADRKITVEFLYAGIAMMASPSRCTKVKNGNSTRSAPASTTMLTSIGIRSKTHAQLRMASGRLRSFLT